MSEGEKLKTAHRGMSSLAQPLLTLRACIALIPQTCFFTDVTQATSFCWTPNTAIQQDSAQEEQCTPKLEHCKGAAATAQQESSPC